MNTPELSYDTLSQAVNSLMARGYTTDFLIETEKDCLICKIKGGEAKELPPEEFKIDEVYRYEGMTDPGDESIVFAISSPVHGIKGIVINSYGADFGYRSSKLVEHLRKSLKN